MGKKGENREKTNIAAVEKKVKIGGLGGSRGKNGGINRVGNVEGSVLDRIYRMGRIRFWWPCVPSNGRGGSPLPPARFWPRRSGEGGGMSHAEDAEMGSLSVLAV